MQATILRLGHLGDGIAEGPVFVPRTLPGEVVEGELSGDRLASPRIVTPSSNRVSAPCPHYRGCGGCALQHASDDFVADWKAGVVETALSAVGIEAKVRRVHTSPPGSRRRATFTGRRTKSGAIIGFHAPYSDAIREVPHCLLVRPALVEALPVLERIVTLGGSRKGEVRLTVTETDSGLDVAVTGGKPIDVSLQAHFGAVAAEAGLARLSWDREVVAMERPPLVQFGRAQVTPPPGAFLQATTEGEAALVAGVREALDGATGDIVDLFAGCGTFSLPLAERGHVHAVEAEEEMLEALDRGWRHAPGLHAVTTETRDLFRRPLDAEALSHFGAAVIDPPRAGAERQVESLAASNISRVAMVSCSPVTFARDTARLVQAGFGIAWMDVVDQFRWSTHVEIIAAFTR
ncbi:class I SAM-dependent RNA methyltransferase [Silicimonas algicola]|uniref:23S rRNA m(5)U-1939 methyltransferase n=1 Tax=Silicimonas algicola TaxID=1826607 RepID=A0A316G788_9RHOB|nr:class I SAM-dependent RNA methyltransferase [Silicimonas algicola]AZQ69427.1 class I SAM-dependent RNA methyltransferase [Silicimonas algicola]PWK56492.1 23S rRNA m(5)U-1939 methyltransferase [Silicimonas algicola]